MKRLLLIAFMLTCLPLPGGGQDKNGTGAVGKTMESLPDNLKSQIARLASEHAHVKNKARDWLLDHAALSRPALLDMAQAGRPVHLALEAAYLLGLMADEGDVPVLADVLASADPLLTWGIAQALGSHASDSALAALIDCLKHADAEVAGASAVALGVRGDERAREPLEQLLDHADEGVRHRAVLALQKLNARPSAGPLRQRREQEPSADVRQLIDEALRDPPAGPGG